VTESTPSEPAQSSPVALKPLTLPMLLLKTTVLALGIFLVLALISLVGLAIFGWRHYQLFLKAAELSHSEIVELYQQSHITEPRAESGRTVFLVLGTDTVANKSAPPLTDTMLLTAINPFSGEVAMLSLPRDLWSDEFQTKANSLYYYGLERYPERPEAFVEEVIEDLTGVPIDYTVVVSLAHVEELISLVGGVEIDIPQGFTDEQFPRDDVDLSLARTDAELYETISFEPGKQILDSKKALQYIRSRHSDGETGTDDNRAERQQLVITALVQQMSLRQLIRSPELSGSLVKWYRENFEQGVPIPDAVALAKKLYPHLDSLTISQNTLSIYPNDRQGVIEHPPISRQYQNQWVYRVRDRAVFKENVQGILLGSSNPGK